VLCQITTSGHIIIIFVKSQATQLKLFALCSDSGVRTLQCSSATAFHCNNFNSMSNSFLNNDYEYEKRTSKESELAFLDA
jgi:hypothetical protein